MPPLRSTEVTVKVNDVRELFREREFDPFRDDAADLGSIARMAQLPHLVAKLNASKLRILLPEQSLTPETKNTSTARTRQVLRAHDRPGRAKAGRPALGRPEDVSGGIAVFWNKPRSVNRGATALVRSGGSAYAGQRESHRRGMGRDLANRSIIWFKAGGRSGKRVESYPPPC
jgi:hypothetical protein